MNDVSIDHGRCHQVGWLILKNSCFALRSEDGDEYWLEMDRIPHHLIDERVTLDGVWFGSKLIAVDGIGPA